MSDLLTRIARERELQKIRGKKSSSGSHQAELVEQLPLPELLQSRINDLRRLLPPAVSGDEEAMSEYLAGPEFSDAWQGTPQAKNRKKAEAIFQYLLGVADAHDATVLTLLDDYRVKLVPKAAPAAAAARTRLDQLLERVKPGKSELTIDTSGYTRAQVDQILAAAKARGLHAAASSNAVLVRDLSQVATKPAAAPKALRKGASVKKAPKPITGYPRSMLAVLHNAHIDGGRPAHFGSKKDKATLKQLVKLKLARIMKEVPGGPEGVELWAVATPKGLETYEAVSTPRAPETRDFESSAEAHSYATVFNGTVKMTKRPGFPDYYVVTLPPRS